MVELTAEQEAIRQTVNRICREHVAPRAAEMDRTGEFPWAIIQELARRIGGEMGADQALEKGDLGRLHPVEQVGRAAAVRSAEACCDWDRTADPG